MKKIIFILVTILMSIAIMESYFWVSAYLKSINNCSWVIEYNWNVKLPTNYSKAYDYNDKSSDGEDIRYHILEYNNKVELNKCLKWTQNVEPTVIDLVNSTIKSKNLGDKYTLKKDCNYKFFSKTRYDGSKLNILFDENLNTIYILEDII